MVVESEDAFAYGALVSTRHVLSAMDLVANDVAVVLGHAPGPPPTRFEVTTTAHKKLTARAVAVDVASELLLLELDGEVAYAPRAERDTPVALGEPLTQWTAAAPALGVTLGFNAPHDVSAVEGHVIAATSAMVLLDAGALGDRGNGALITDRRGRWVGVSRGGVSDSVHAQRGVLAVLPLSALPAAFASPPPRWTVSGLPTLREGAPLALERPPITWLGDSTVVRLEASRDGSACTSPPVIVVALDEGGAGPHGAGCVEVRAGETLGLAVQRPADVTKIALTLSRAPAQEPLFTDGLVSLASAPDVEVLVVIDEAHRAPERLDRALAGEHVPGLTLRAMARGGTTFAAPKLALHRRYRVLAAAEGWRGAGVFRAGRERLVLETTRGEP